MFMVHVIPHGSNVFRRPGYRIVSEEGDQAGEGRI